MISKTTTHFLFNKQNSTYNDNNNNNNNNNNDYNGLFATGCIVEAFYSITDAQEFCKNIQEYSAQIHRSPVTDYRVRGLNVYSIKMTKHWPDTVF